MDIIRTEGDGFGKRYTYQEIEEILEIIIIILILKYDFFFMEIWWNKKRSPRREKTETPVNFSSNNNDSICLTKYNQDVHFKYSLHVMLFRIFLLFLWILLLNNRMKTNVNNVLYMLISIVEQYFSNGN